MSAAPALTPAAGVRRAARRRFAGGGDARARRRRGGTRAAPASAAGRAPRAPRAAAPRRDGPRPPGAARRRPTGRRRARRWGRRGRRRPRARARERPLRSASCEERPCRDARQPSCPPAGGGGDESPSGPGCTAARASAGTAPAAAVAWCRCRRRRRGARRDLRRPSSPRRNLQDFRQDVPQHSLLPRVRRRRGRRGHALHIRARRVLEREAQLIIKTRADGVEVARPRGSPMRGPRVVLVHGVPFRLERRLLLRHRDLWYCFWGDLRRAASLLRRRDGRRAAPRRRLGRRQALEAVGLRRRRGARLWQWRFARGRRGGARLRRGRTGAARARRFRLGGGGAAARGTGLGAGAGAAFGSPLVHAAPASRSAAITDANRLSSSKPSSSAIRSWYVVLGPLR